MARKTILLICAETGYQIIGREKRVALYYVKENRTSSVKLLDKTLKEMTGSLILITFGSIDENST